MSTALNTAHDDLGDIARVRYVVGYAGDKPLRIVISGHPYRFRPHTEVEIVDQYDYERDEKTGNPIGNSTKRPDVEGVPRYVPKGRDAYGIVKALFRDEDGLRGSSRGLYIVRGDGRDMERHEAAHRKYVEERVQLAKKVQREWMVKIEKVKPGDIPPVQPQHVREEMAFLAAHESGVLNRKAFIAFDGGFESDDRDEVLQYVKLMHKAKLAAEGEGACIKERDALVPRAQAVPAPRPTLVTTPADVPPPPADVPPPPAPVDTGDADFLFETAEELGVSLTAAESKSILRGDRAVMEAITARLIAAKKGA